MTEYRIKRVDARNIAIQQKKGKKNKQWVSISYHGNNIKSLTGGLADLLLKDYTPSGKNLAQEVKNLRLAVISMYARIEVIVRHYEVIQEKKV